MLADSAANTMLSLVVARRRLDEDEVMSAMWPVAKLQTGTENAKETANCFNIMIVMIVWRQDLK